MKQSWNFQGEGVQTKNLDNNREMDILWNDTISM